MGLTHGCDRNQLLDGALGGKGQGVKGKGIYDSLFCFSFLLFPIPTKYLKSPPLRTETIFCHSEGSEKSFLRLEVPLYGSESG